MTNPNLASAGDRPNPVAIVALAALAILTLAVPPVCAAESSDGTSARPAEDREFALVQLNGEPLATYVKTKPQPGKKIDFSGSTVKAYRAQLAALRNSYKAWLRANVPQAKVTSEFDLSLNAVSVKLGGATLAQVAASPLVRPRSTRACTTRPRPILTSRSSTPPMRGP